MGVDVNTIANIVITSFSGNIASKIRLRDSINFDSDVIVRLENKNRNNISGINKIMIPTPKGITPISSLANINKDMGPMEIKRKDDKRIIEITANSFGRPVNDIVSDIRKELNNIYIPMGFTVNFSGDYEDMQEAFTQLLVSLIMALILVYAIIVLQFESYIIPFVISLAAPFALFSILVFLYFSLNTLNVYSGIGIIMLIGIVLIDFMNKLFFEKEYKLGYSGFGSMQKKNASRSYDFFDYYFRFISHDY